MKEHLFDSSLNSQCVSFIWEKLYKHFRVQFNAKQSSTSKFSLIRNINDKIYVSLDNNIVVHKIGFEKNLKLFLVSKKTANIRWNEILFNLMKKVFICLYWHLKVEFISRICGTRKNVSNPKIWALSRKTKKKK